MPAAAKVSGVVPSGRVRIGVVRLCAAISVLVALASLLTGLAQGLDDNLLTMRGALLCHPASGRIALAEIDARSLAEYARWPWPRSLHARAVDALNRAGAAQIAFDVDFSAVSTPQEDAALAAAIARSRAPVILPTFRQTLSQGSGQWSENLPIPALRSHAMLSSVNVSPDGDGLVRSLLSGVATGGQPRPSLAAALAMRGGRIGEQVPIDRSIDADTVPRFSLADLLHGRLAPGSLAGKSVLIGATAIEMGDRYAMPGKGVLPGALVQVLAAETLLRDSAPASHGAWAGLAVVAMLAGWTVRRRRLPGWLGIGLCGWLLLALPLVCEAVRLGTLEVAPGLAGLAAMALAGTLLRAYEAVRAGRLCDGETGLPNAAALQAGGAPGGVVMVLRFANFADVQSALGARLAGRLVLRVVERLGSAVDGAIHRVEPGALAWLAEETGEIAEEDAALAVAALCNQPFEIDGRAIRVVPVLGSAGTAGGVGDALARALAAAEAAHLQGRRWLRHSAGAAEERDWRLALAGELDGALAGGAIWLAYQPKFDIARGAITAVEALVRWTHPQRGAIPPDRLVALVEEIGRIEDFTLFVLERALAEMGDWLAAGHDVGVAVNVSAQLPSRPGFVARVIAVLDRFPQARGRLTLEITESAALADAGQAVAALEQLAATGIRISIDDYGTGQSTLAYLKGLPASEIKIDKSFVQALESSRSDQLMVQSTIQLAHGLGYKVVAEGVESAPVLDLLAGYGCDSVQGWHTGKPMAASRLIAFLDARQGRASEAA
ncbi:MAG: EAL domain-containing protein [Sphingomonadales bacterium]|nr:EAL domain-containing protein [Sphingomonadales bacterium]